MSGEVVHGENGLTWIVVTDDDNEPEARFFITTTQLATRYNAQRSANIVEALKLAGIQPEPCGYKDGECERIPCGYRDGECEHGE